MLPHFLVIGASKCGTTSLHHYLDDHPEIDMAPAGDVRRREVNFFIRPRWRHHLARYERLFELSAPLRGERSTSYSMHAYAPHVPERIHSLMPDVKLIYLVRDPIERLLAHYVEWVWRKFENRPIEQALRDYTDLANPYVCASRYATQIERYLAFFPESQFLTIDQEDLLRRRPQTLRAVFAFLGASPAYESSAFDGLLNIREEKLRLNRVGRSLARRGSRLVERPPSELPVTTRRALFKPIESPTIDEPTRDRLAGLLGAEADRLRALTGQAFPRWSL